MELGNYEYQSDFAKKYVAKGRTEGLAEGRAEGLAEGRVEGLVEGRAEGLVEGRAECRAEGLTEGRAEGLAKGRAESLLVLLEARGFTVSEALRQRIRATQELNMLDTWCRRAARATELAEIFDDLSVSD